jgi:hypothetical protein
MNPTPRDVAHRVLFSVGGCGSQARRLMFGMTARRAVSLGRRVYCLGVTRDGRILFCSTPGCRHRGVPFAIPAVDELELAANDPDYRRSPRVIEWRGHGLDFPSALGFDWPPGTYQAPWWFE